MVGAWTRRPGSRGWVKRVIAGPDLPRGCPVPGLRTRLRIHDEPPALVPTATLAAVDAVPVVFLLSS